MRRWVWLSRASAFDASGRQRIDEAASAQQVASDADRWRSYLERRDALIADMSGESRARFAQIDIAAWIDEDRDSH